MESGRTRQNIPLPARVDRYNPELLHNFLSLRSEYPQLTHAPCEF